MLYTKQQVGGEKKVFHLSCLFTSLTTADMSADSSVAGARSTAEQTSCTQQPFAGIVCCAAFQLLGSQQLPQPINRAGLKMKSPASTRGLLTPRGIRGPFRS